MNCSEFLERYSEFADHLLDERTEIAARRHLAACPACRKYDRVLHAGVSLLRELPLPLLSADFAVRVRERLTAPASPLAAWSGVVAGMLVAAAVILFAREVAESDSARARAAVRSPARARPVPVVMAGVPFIAFRLEPVPR